MNAALHKIDSAINSPPTPNSSLSSHSNNISIGSPSTPQLSLTSNTPTPGCSTSGHKNSLKGTKLARRARSFKDDLFEKISLMRTPTNTLGRAHSPHSPRNKNTSTKSHTTAEDVVKSSQSLDTHVKDISNALKHFRDVILKKKLEVLPGNGTVILETIASMYAVIQSYMLNENSTVLLSATQQVYQSLGKLIKLCDEVMLSDENSECVSLSNENVREVVDLLEDAVKNLVLLAQLKLKEKDESEFQFASNLQGTTTNNISHNHLMHPPIEIAGRTSLPDITLTPRERDILEKTKSNPIRASHSTESILRDTSPPPKPPLPNRCNNPPPLPPKRRFQQQQPNQHSNNISINSDLDCSTDFSLLNYGVDHLSVRSRSPDENSSQCSLDSALNHSREEEELKALGLETRLDEHLLEDDVEKMFAFSSFASMKSFRTSTQSVSKRSSDYSFQSSSKSSNSDIGFGTGEIFTSEFCIQQKQQQVQTISTTSNYTSGKCSTDATEKHFSNAKLASSVPLDGFVIAYNDNQSNNITICGSPDHFERDSMDIFSDDLASQSVTMPPALPPKISKNKERLYFHNDKFDQTDDSNSMILHEIPELRRHDDTQHHKIYQCQTKHQSLIEPRRLGSISGSCNAIGSTGNPDEPPPLPIKKKHILAYMEICSASTRTFEQHRHTMHTYNLNRNITHSQTMNIVPSTTELKTPDVDVPPALPPKIIKRKQTSNPTIITTPPPSPKPTNADNYNDTMRFGRILSNTVGNEQMSTVCEEMYDMSDEDQTKLQYSHYLPNEIQNLIVNSDQDLSTQNLPDRDDENTCDLQNPTVCSPDVTNEEDEGIDILLDNSSCNKKGHVLPKNNLPNMLEEIDITPFLILKKEHEDGPEVKGGYIDALIVHASRVQKNSDNAFSEAFISTFRTFIQPTDVIEKLTHRYTIFFCQINDLKQKAAKETFSLLVRVVNDLTSNDLTSPLFTLLVEFVYQLVCSGQLYQAKLLRNKILEKVMIYKEQKLPIYHDDMHFTVTNQPSLLDLKSSEIAEQMTLLDADLFQKIEIPEVLLFAKEQCEEKSPNLNKFTEHFNKMSYWARSKILMLSDPKEREKHVIKFIKIMKHLRKMNNYNSYLALLSALDSAPIRRLEWHKTITEGLKEYCTLIDSSSSFRVYRQALAETSPPCIPYIGLVLQDLTFVHVGNPDYLKEGVINFSKRWQQYNIIDNMKRFKKCTYPFRRNERIIRFFENFENFLGEEEMWQISETIKPRSKRSVYN